MRRFSIVVRRVAAPGLLLSYVLPDALMTLPRSVARLAARRASDPDREQIAKRPRHATVGGQLGADQLEERLAVLYSARTYGELDTLVADLPAITSTDQACVGVPVWPGAAVGVALLVGVLAAAVGIRRSAVAAAPIGRELTHHAGPGVLAQVGPESFAIAALIVGLVARLGGLSRARPAFSCGRCVPSRPESAAP